jgi:hypothetical protein
LNDPRFKEGIELTVVADGNTAKEVHLGYRRRQGEASTSPAKSSTTKSRGSTKASSGASKTGTATKTAPNPASKAAASEDDEDEDNEIPGTVKSFDPNRRLLVLALLNGKSRSFLLSNDVKVLVRGTASKAGLKDPAIKAGVSLTVFTEAGGRRVRELHVEPPRAAGGKKAA